MSTNDDDLGSLEEAVRMLVSTAIRPLKDGDYELGLDTLKKLYVVVRMVEPKFELHPPDTELDSIKYSYFVDNLDQMISILVSKEVLPWDPEAETAGVQL
jgi:hypothetical protein